MENAHTQWENNVHIEIKEDKRLFSALVTVTCRGNWDRGKKVARKCKAALSSYQHVKPKL